MKQLRTVLFWMHLCCGLAAGLVVAVMGATGAALAFETELAEWAERGSREVTPPAPGAARLPLDALLAKARPAAGAGPAGGGGERGGGRERGGPGAQLAVTVSHDAGDAVRVASGREGGVHVDPYTGEVRPLAGAGWRAFFGKMVELHRHLGTSGDQRAVGRAITGAANAAFLFLALSGLYLWWPRRWSQRALRLSLWFRGGLAGKARDWNWHNVIGFWSLPVLIVVTFSGMMISYRAVSNLIYRVAGEAPPPAAGGGPGAAPAVTVPAPPPGAAPLSLEAMVQAAGRAAPDWRTITVRNPGGRGREGKAPAVTLSLKHRDGWPLFATTQLTLDPYTGAVLKREGYREYSAGRKLRSWLRFLHTGQALGWPGQLLAGLVSLGATVMVWTGLALAWRRLVPRRRAAAAPLSDQPAP
jgi:uncharacterized iron-regulated membrane protein